MHIDAVPVIVELPIKASKNKQEPSNEGAGVSSSGQRAASAINKCPFFIFGIKIVKVVLIFSVSASEDKKFVVEN